MRFFSLVLLVACGSTPSGGGTGAGTIVVTTPFLGTMGFASSVAVGRPIIVAVQREGAPDGSAAAEMALQVSGGPYRIVELAAGQALVWLDTEADYRFTAVRYGAFAGQEPLVRARTVQRIRTYEKAIRTTRDDEKKCVQKEELSITELSLAPNQEIAITVVATDATENPTLGWLSLELQTVPTQVNVETPFLGSAGTPNTFIVRPAEGLGAPVTLTINEKETKQTVAVQIETGIEPAPCEVVE